MIEISCGEPFQFNQIARSSIAPQNDGRDLRMMTRISKVRYEHGCCDTLTTSPNKSSELFAMLTGGREVVTVDAGFQVHNFMQHSLD